MEYVIRPASPADAEAILRIYAPYVVGTCVTFETEAPAVGEFAERIAGIAKSYPYLVCEIGNGIVGYAYASKHHERAAYKHTADVSVYVAPQYHRRGIGGALYAELFGLLRGWGIYTVCACIALPNDKSVGMHGALGFAEAGVFHSVGRKFGKWLDVMWMEKALMDYGEPASERAADGGI
ncbi:MAG: GNAT family N-acetyltransferase [Clostridiales bacterium]|jgi:phosphinothricin acetyltransferase|nr:GNAT family N-acetyltransferase [Clostridiales bacterium]